MEKKTVVGIVIILVMIMISSSVFAVADELTVPSGGSSQSLGLGNLDNYKGTNASSDTLKSKANNILGLIQIVGVIVSVVMLMAIGIKYMLGSVEEKAEYKETLKPYIIGAFVLFTGTTIPNIIYKFTQNL